MSAGTELEKRKRVIKPINRNRRAVQWERANLQAVLTAFLAGQATAIAQQITDAIADEKRTEASLKLVNAWKSAIGEPMQKVDEPDPVIIGRILRAISFDDWASIVETVDQILVNVLEAGHSAAFAQIGHAASEEITAQVHAEALSWARARAAELVGMRRLASGTLVPNPDARWAITESTREALRGDVVRALEEGWSNDQLAAALGESYAFSANRAETIARTETARADVEGNLEAYRGSGEVDGKRWLLGSEHLTDGIVDECDTAAQMGTVPLDSDWGGLGDPPLHPNCLCDVVPVLAEGGSGQRHPVRGSGAAVARSSRPTVRARARPAVTLSLFSRR